MKTLPEVEHAMEVNKNQSDVSAHAGVQKSGGPHLYSLHARAASYVTDVHTGIMLKSPLRVQPCLRTLPLNVVVYFMQCTL